VTEANEAKRGAKGGFFIVSRSLWSAVCDLGLNEAVGYLALSCGTARNNRSTSWSLESMRKHTGISWVRGRAALDRLVSAGLMAYGEKHTKDKPRYEIVSKDVWTQKVRFHSIRSLNSWDQSVLNPLLDHPTSIIHKKKSNASSVKTLVEKGLIREQQYGEYVLVPDSKSEEDPIWLPNTIVTGTERGEASPVKRLRSNGDIWTLRLFVDLYDAHNLRDDGGISPWLLRYNYERKKVGEHASYTLWGFKASGGTAWHLGPFERHNVRPKLEDGGSPVWHSLNALEGLGLLSFVPHLWDGPPGEGKMGTAEIVHPYGIAGVGGEPIEIQIGSAAHKAVLSLAYSERLQAAASEGFRHFCPVRSALPNVQLVGVGRLRYRPHTRRTGAWYVPSGTPPENCNASR
jgi:hypothetical protein